ncbi:MAG: hypothetical protein QG623_171, partial [Patescibacteria group bacterium]|nr:hypothetical protein [Patescibacteria group bacterium]
SLMDFGTPSPLPWAGSGIVVEPNDPQTIQRRSESRADKWHADYDSSRTTAFHRVRVASFPYGTRYLLPGEVPGLERALQLPPHQAAEFIIGDEGQVIIASAIDRGDVAVNQVKPGEVLEFPEMLLHRAPTSEERNGLRAFVRSSA